MRKGLEQIIARTRFVMHQGTFGVERIFINDAISLDIHVQKFPLTFSRVYGLLLGSIWYISVKVFSLHVTLLVIIGVSAITVVGWCDGPV